MTKVSKSILQDIQKILDVPIPKEMHPAFAALVDAIAKLVGSNEGILEALTDLQVEVERLKQFRKFTLDR
jgi:hypothetical protein